MAPREHSLKSPERQLTQRHRPPRQQQQHETQHEKQHEKQQSPQQQQQSQSQRPRAAPRPQPTMRVRAEAPLEQRGSTLGDGARGSSPRRMTTWHKDGEPPYSRPLNAPQARAGRHGTQISSPARRTSQELAKLLLRQGRGGAGAERMQTLVGSENAASQARDSPALFWAVPPPPPPAN